MNQPEVITLLEQNKNEAGIKKWNQKYNQNEDLKSFGIGLTILRKLAKQIGRNHKLALELWKSRIYDVKIIALLIDDPTQITWDQAEFQVEDLKEGHLMHVFSSCDASLAKTSFVVELSSHWINNEDPIRRSCGYGLLYEISKWKKKSVPNEAFFLDKIDHISSTFSNENFHVKGSMGGALMGIGKRSVALNTAALKVAQRIGPIPFGSEDNTCEPFNVVKHLTSDYIKKKLGI